ncbi:hypothetical protein Droror1_Dr00017517 [Drosera rotundifolia]
MLISLFCLSTHRVSCYANKRTSQPSSQPEKPLAGRGFMRNVSEPIGTSNSLKHTQLGLEMIFRVGPARRGQTVLKPTWYGSPGPCWASVRGTSTTQAGLSAELRLLIILDQSLNIFGS